MPRSSDFAGFNYLNLPQEDEDQTPCFALYALKGDEKRNLRVEADSEEDRHLMSVAHTMWAGKTACAPEYYSSHLT